MYISKCRQDFEVEDFQDDYILLEELKIESGDILSESPSIEVVPNVKICVYTASKPFSYEQAKGFIIDKYFGEMSIESQDYGYSEYTIEGFNIYSLKIGNHDLLEILNSNDKFKLFTIEKV